MYQVVLTTTNDSVICNNFPRGTDFITALSGFCEQLREWVDVDEIKSATLYYVSKPRLSEERTAIIDLDSRSGKFEHPFVYPTCFDEPLNICF